MFVSRKWKSGQIIYLFCCTLINILACVKIKRFFPSTTSPSQRMSIFLKALKLRSFKERKFIDAHMYIHVNNFNLHHLKNVKFKWLAFIFYLR